MLSTILSSSMLWICFLFCRHLHTQTPHWGAESLWYISISFLLSTTCLCQKAPLNNLLSHWSNKMHRLVIALVVAQWESSESQLLLLLFCLMFTKAMGNSLHLHRLPSGNTWQHRSGRKLYSSLGYLNLFHKPNSRGNVCLTVVFSFQIKMSPFLRFFHSMINY